ncbi:MAG: VOC family protein [Chloroflexi bacterium]|nr:VOC family protein [Chloroflexota bacterium]
MITRFDHVVIGVRDLNAAAQRYRQLGFDVRPGGRHTGLGTHNAIIRFGLDYIELISIYDEAEVRKSRLGRQVLIDFLREREGGLLGYALATTDIEQEAERFRGTELLVEEPFAMQRQRPDGRLLAWRLLIPGGYAWRRPWPFLIQWDAPDEQRLSWEEPGTHPNGATRWTRATVVVRSLESAIDLYQRQLGLALQDSGEDSRLVARRVTFSLGASSIDLLTPTGEGLAQQVLTELGEGLLEVRFAVKDLNQARSFLQQDDIDFEPEAAGPGTLLISPQHALGARLILTKKD